MIECRFSEKDIKCEWCGEEIKTLFAFYTIEKDINVCLKCGKPLVAEQEKNYNWNKFFKDCK